MAVVAVATLTGSGDGGGELADADRRDAERPVPTTGRPDAGRTSDAVTADDPSPLTPPDGDADPRCQGEADGTLTIGGLLPETGDLSFAHPAMDAGARMAVAHINEAGGVLGRDVVYLPGDSGDGTPDVASATVEGHLAAGADVILGAAGDLVSLDVIDRVTDACRIQFSPAANSPVFTDYEDDDLFFRTSPSDTLQGQALADLAIDDGHTTAAIVARDDGYGSELLAHTRSAFERQGGQVVLNLPYDPDLAPGPEAASDIAAIAEAVVEADPQALVLIGFDETAAILSGIYERGFTSRSHGVYLADGSIGDAFGADFTGQGSLAGVKGTVPIAEPLAPFTAYMHTFDASIGRLDHAAETYDAVVMTALASIIAGTDDPAAVAHHINGLTGGGERCDAFDDCVELIGTGADIDLIGYSGPQAFSQPGEPTIASFTVWEFGPDNRLDSRSYHLTRFR